MCCISSMFVAKRSEKLHCIWRGIPKPGYYNFSCQTSLLLNTMFEQSSSDIIWIISLKTKQCQTSSPKVSTCIFFVDTMFKKMSASRKTVVITILSHLQQDFSSDFLWQMHKMIRTWEQLTKINQIAAKLLSSGSMWWAVWDKKKSNIDLWRWSW